MPDAENQKPRECVLLAPTGSSVEGEDLEKGTYPRNVPHKVM